MMPTSANSIGSLLVAAYKAAPIGIAVLTPSGRILGGNGRLAEMLGRTPASLEGLGLSDISRPSDVEWSLRWLSELAGGEHRFLTTDRVFLLPDGDERMARVTAWRVAGSGRGPAIISTVTPVPPRAGLVDGRVRKLIENIGDTISLIDADGNLLETSGRYRPILGYPAEFWETRTIFELLHPEDAAMVLELREQVLAEPGHLIEQDFRVRGVDGHYEPIHVSAVNLLDDPDVAGIVVTSRNIAAEKAMLAALAERTERAEREATLRSRLVATVSHELRNPLHAIGGIAELLATGDLPNEFSDLAATMHRQVTALTSVLDDLLDSSRLAASGVELQVRAVDVRAVCNDLVQVMSSAARGSEVTVVGNVATDVPELIEADSSRLRQVLTNLLGNAVKFTERGAVELDVAVESGSMLRFVVTDSGRGIPADEIDKVFSPFVSATNAGESGGAGLGLSIVRQLVDAMGGSIEASSVVGVGSSFVVRLPLVESTGDAAPTVEADHRGSETVLVVEDNPVNQTLARSQLARLGYGCVVVGSGEEALQVLESSDAPRVVLLDFQLPGIDGLETARRLRLSESGAVRRVVIGVTASAMVADRESCLAAGMDDFLAKPVGLAALGDMLRRWAVPTTDGSSVAVAPTAVGPTELDILAAELGDVGIVHQLIDTYLAELDDRALALHHALERGIAEALRQGAHSLKSSSALLGLTDLAASCRRLEQGGVRPDTVRESVLQLRQQTSEAKAVLERWKSANPVGPPA
ncbi:MAG: hypothetical protein RL238_684 [Actinomycetota bacterium]|jgi:PAS domain S-box-containing protein